MDLDDMAMQLVTGQWGASHCVRVDAHPPHTFGADDSECIGVRGRDERLLRELGMDRVAPPRPRANMIREMVLCPERALHPEHWWNNGSAAEVYCPGVGNIPDPQLRPDATQRFEVQGGSPSVNEFVQQMVDVRQDEIMRDVTGTMFTGRPATRMALRTGTGPRHPLSGLPYQDCERTDQHPEHTWTYYAGPHVEGVVRHCEGWHLPIARNFDTQGEAMRALGQMMELRGQQCDHCPQCGMWSFTGRARHVCPSEHRRAESEYAVQARPRVTFRPPEGWANTATQLRNATRGTEIRARVADIPIDPRDRDE